MKLLRQEIAISLHIHSEIITTTAINIAVTIITMYHFEQRIGSMVIKKQAAGVPHKLLRAM